MASFALAIDFVLAHEGGYSNKASDPGGETNFGITKRDFPNEDIAGMTRERAVTLYREHYWRWGYKALQSQDVANKVFDMAVNAGHRRSHKLLQRALNAAGHTLAEDGAFGPDTLAACNDTSEVLLLPLIRLEAVSFYTELAYRREALRIFLIGWIRRALV